MYECVKVVVRVGSETIEGVEDSSGKSVDYVDKHRGGEYQAAVPSSSAATITPTR